MAAESYEFEIHLPRRQVYRSEKFYSYKAFITACEKKCREMHAKASDVKILFNTEYGGTCIRGPEHGEIVL